MIAALAALIAVAVAVLVTLTPLLRDEPVHEPEVPGADLADKRDEALAALRDVDLDHAMGKITDDDRERLRAELEGRAVRILAEIDAGKPPETGRGA